MKKLLSLVLLISSFCNAQFTYRQSVVGTDTLVYRIDFEGKAVRVQRLPADATRAKIGVQRLNTYTPEAKATFNLAQFPKNLYFDSTYFFSVDINLNLDNLAQRKAQGISMFSRFCLPNQAEYDALPARQKFYYQTENELHNSFEGARYWESSLAELEAQYYSAIPAGMGYWVANIETSVEWHKWMYESGFHGYDSWNSAKNRTFKLESVPNTTMTLEAFFNSNLVQQEYTVRRANRLAVMMTIAKQRNLFVAHGTSMHQAEPRTNSLKTTGIFIEGSPNLTNIGGTSTGSITLNGRSYTGLTKNVYGYESSMLDYYYYFGWDKFSLSDYADIWVNKLPGTQTMPYIWSKIAPYHIVASEKGHWQANRHRMATIPGQTMRGSVRMQEPNYEDKFYTTDGVAHNSFVPFAELQNINLSGYNITPKVFLEPYIFYSAYAVHRFLEGNTPGAGYHLWNDPSKSKLPASHPIYNHHLHSISQLFHARYDYQILERFYPGSTLVENPDVQLNQTGNWLNYSGAEAFGFEPDGGRSAQLPAYTLRFKPTSSGWQVYIQGGTNQKFTESRTDLIRVPGGLLGGNMFRVKLTGPSAQLFEFSVSSTDTGQIYEAINTITTTRTGYASRLSSN